MKLAAEVYKAMIRRDTAVHNDLTALPDDSPMEDHACSRGAASSRPNDAWVNGTTRETDPDPTGH